MKNYEYFISSFQQVINFKHCEGQTYHPLKLLLKLQIPVNKSFSF